MPKRAPPAHRIGRVGSNLFRNLLPEEWIPRSEEGADDYGVDYTIEVVEGEQLTGLRCVVQLKSTENAKWRADSLILTIDVAEILYLDSKQLAAFIVAVDIERKEFYWLEAHDVVRGLNARRGSEWKKQGTITLSIPKQNTSGLAAKDWPAMSRQEPGKIAVGQYGLLPFREFRDAAGLASARPEEIRKKQAQVHALESGLYVEEAMAHQDAADFDSAELSIQKAWTSALDSGDAERIAAAAKLLVISSRIMDDDEGALAFEVASRGHRAAEEGGFKADAAFLRGMMAVVAGHRLVKRLAHARLTQQIVASSDHLTRWFADHGVLLNAETLGVALDDLMDCLQAVEAEGNYVLMAELLRFAGVLECVAADYAAICGEGDTAPLRNLGLGHLEVSLSISRALKDDDLVFQSLMDLAVTHAKVGMTPKAESFLAEGRKLVSTMKGGKAHEPRLKRVGTLVRNPPVPQHKDYAGVSEEEKDEVFRKLAKMGGYNVDAPENEMDRVIAIGLKDRNPERVLKWCKHLDVEIVGTGVPGRLLGLSSAGMKMMHCDQAPHAEVGMDLDALLKGFQDGPCVGCPKRELRDPSWRWTEDWARNHRHSDMMEERLARFRDAPES